MSAIDQIKNYFGLIKLPFSKGLSVNELYLSSSVKNAISGLEIATQNEEVALITGTSGSGKSNVLRYFMSTLDSQEYLSAYICANQCKIGEIAKRALLALGIPAPYQSSAALRKLRQAVLEISSIKGQKIILMIDEAQELAADTLLELKSLINYKMDNDNLMFLLLCGHSNLADTLKMIPLESLERRIRIRCEIAPLSLEETCHYIKHHLNISGLKTSIMSDEAITLIYQLSRGIPSEINKFSFNAIIKAAAESKQIIDPSLIQAKK